jgi:ATP-dependent DNA ligase
MLQRARAALLYELRHRSNDQKVILIAFDLLELDGSDLRREPLEVRAQGDAGEFAPRMSVGCAVQ